MNHSESISLNRGSRRLSLRPLEYSRKSASKIISTDENADSRNMDSLLMITHVPPGSSAASCDTKLEATYADSMKKNTMKYVLVFFSRCRFITDCISPSMEIVSPVTAITRFTLPYAVCISPYLRSSMVLRPLVSSCEMVILMDGTLIP